MGDVSHASPLANSTRTDSETNSDPRPQFVGEEGKPIEEFLKNYEPARRIVAEDGTVVLPVLGSGTFGSVSLYKPRVQHLFKVRGGGAYPHTVAVKKFKFGERVRREHMITRENIRREAKILMDIHFDNIVKGYEFYEGPNDFYLVMEYVTGGTLLEALSKLEKNSFTEEDARTIIYQLLSGLGYCHARKLYHRDIKPENILLKSKVPNQTPRQGQPPQGLMSTFRMLDERFEVVLADFGLATSDPTAHPAGTLEYTAPEIRKIFCSTNPKVFPYDKADVWSLGVVAYIILSGGYYPFDGSAHSTGALVGEIADFRIEKASAKFLDDLALVSDHGRDFLMCMLNEDYDERHSVAELCRHSWFDEPSKVLQKNSLNMNKFSDTHSRMVAVREQRILARYSEIQAMAEVIEPHPRPGEGGSTEYPLDQQLLFSELEMFAESSEFIKRLEHFDPDQGNPNVPPNL